jgi:hypothetical protein
VGRVNLTLVLLQRVAATNLESGSLEFQLDCLIPYYITGIITAACRAFAQPFIHWVLAALSPEVKRPGREADNSPPTTAEVKKTWVYMVLCLIN